MSATPPPGARCARHSDVDAAALCARCGDFVCEKCVVRIAGGTYCVSCEALAGPGFPWEERRQLGSWNAWKLTMRGTLLGTSALFAGAFRDRSVAAALFYGILISTPISLLVTAVELLWPSSVRLELAQHPVGVFLYSDAAQLARGVAAPLLFVLATYLGSIAWWLGLRLSGIAARSFSDIVRTRAYVQGSVAPLHLVVLLPDSVNGPALIVVAIYSLVLEMRALRALLSADAWRLAAAVAVMLLLVSVAICAIGGGMMALVSARIPS